MGFYSVVKLLVQHPGTNINILNRYNQTPLALMSKQFWPDKHILKLLEDLGGTV